MSIFGVGKFLPPGTVSAVMRSVVSACVCVRVSDLLDLAPPAMQISGKGKCLRAFIERRL